MFVRWNSLLLENQFGQRNDVSSEISGISLWRIHGTIDWYIYPTEMDPKGIFTYMNGGMFMVNS